MRAIRISVQMCACLFPLYTFGQTTGSEKVLEAVKLNRKNQQTTNLIQVSEQKLFENTGGNLAEKISQESGISLKQVGASVAKPVIEGLSNNRILILNNGVRHESHDWSDDHAPEIAIGIPTQVKIMKGAQSVRYGSGALAGVIVLEPASLTYDTPPKGSIQIFGNANNSRTGISGYLQGNVGENLAWRLQANAQKGGDYRTAKYVVNNTGIRELGYTGELEFSKNKWKTHTLLSGYYTEMGIFYGAATSNVDDFQERLKLGRPLDYYPYSDKITPPKHLVNHYLFRNKSEFKFGNHHLETLIAYQYNHRKEFDIRRLDRSQTPTQNTQLKALNTELVWKVRPLKNWSIQLGLSHQNKENENISGTGVVPTIPNFVAKNYASFFISEYRTNRLKLDFGTRWDKQDIRSIGYNVYGELYGNKKTFSSFSYTGGLSYDIGKRLSVLLHTGYAWRAPEPFELYINGKQHGIPIYYIGDENLNPERAWKSVAKMNYHSEKFNMGVSVFVQHVNGFIYNIPTGNFRWLISGPSTVFQFVQSNAFLRGGDLEIGFPLIRNLNYSSNASLVLANDSDTSNPLPQMPPFNLHQSLQWDIPNKVLDKFYLKLEHQYFAKQNRYTPAFELIPETPQAYHLYGIKAGAELKLDPKKYIQFFLGVENLTNQVYKNYTDRLRFFLHGKGLDIQFKTQFNF